MKKITREHINLKKVISKYVKKYPKTPTKEENEKKLKVLSQMEKGSEYYRLRDEIALSNGAFAMMYANKYYSVVNDESSIGEMFQEAMLGILESIDTFDLEKKTSFTTYAHFHVRKRLIDYIKKNKLVRAPRDIARNLKHVNNAQNILLSCIGREPTVNEIKEHLEKEGINLKESIVDNALILLDLNSGNHDDAFISQYKNQVYFEEPEGLIRLMEINVSSEVNKFDDRKKEAVKMRFGIEREYPHAPDEVRLILQSQENEFEWL